MHSGHLPHERNGPDCGGAQVANAVRTIKADRQTLQAGHACLSCCLRKLASPEDLGKVLVRVGRAQ